MIDAPLISDIMIHPGARFVCAAPHLYDAASSLNVEYNIAFFQQPACP
ncbi:hypothetical protein FHW83_004109 [Duganella sp. SG902]|nr:hypothetical protein [Duganella sp. SG902]NVM78281.1 hypothetical protein [Duganella sp. SG902]